MPTYDYRCDACGHELEVFQSMSDGPKRKCPACGKLKLVRQIGAGGGILFKGSGFYQTDYRSASYEAGAKAESDSKGANGPGDAKSSGDSKGSGGSKSSGDSKGSGGSKGSGDAKSSGDAGSKPKKASMD